MPQFTEDLINEQLMAQLNTFLPKNYHTKITLESKLVEIGIDSLKLIEFLLDIESKMKMNLSRHFFSFQGVEKVLDIASVIVSIKNKEMP
ncbi:phosphopantetheine-binding protein [Nostoc sp. CHAB 5824]|nr:phosphopantetheine-binding protein [Nostoc sp. CHAB 5824]